MQVIFVLFSVWITVSVIKWVFRGFKRLLFGAPKQGIEEKQKQKPEKDNAQQKKTPAAAPKSTARKQDPKPAQKKGPESTKPAQKKESEPAKPAQKKEPEPAKPAQQKKPEPVKKPAPEEKKTPPGEPRKDLPLCCARCGAPLPAAKCPACGFDHKNTPVIYLCHPKLSQ